MKLPKIILIRHGETKWNIEGRYQGHLNSDLTEKGKLQAQKNAFKIQKEIEGEISFKFFSSPLGRAKESSIIICNTLGLDSKKVIFDARIEEFNYGIFEGKTKSECALHYAKELSDREADKYAYTIEGGESYTLVTQRLYAWLKSVSEEKVIIVVAHEMVNRALRGIYCHLDKETMLLLRQPNDMVLKLENRSESILN